MTLLQISFLRSRGKLIGVRVTVFFLYLLLHYGVCAGKKGKGDGEN